MSIDEKYFVTAALPYINNVPHIGHVVGSHLPADIFARFLRVLGKKVLFIGGTDEHGATTEITALKLGIDPGEYCKKIRKIHSEVIRWLEISYDIFSHTSQNEVHEKLTQKIFLDIYKNGYIIQKTHTMPYCPKDKIYLPDRYVIGTCPYCGYEKAYGNQCEKCGALLEPWELINPRCAICGTPAEFRERTHLYIDYKKLKDKLKEYLNGKDKVWKKYTYSFAVETLKNIRERSITRDLKYGVKVPLPGWEDRVFYVWFDAPIGYISFLLEFLDKILDENEAKKYENFNPKKVYGKENPEGEKDPEIREEKEDGLWVIYEKIKLNYKDIAWAEIEEKKDYILLKNFEVKEEHRNKGIGTKLLKHSEAIAKEKGKPLYVICHNDYCEDFLKKRGYNFIGYKILEEDYWTEAKIYHFLGKDNIPFHTVWWPGMLIASGRKPPEVVVGLQFLNFEGQKISKSRKWGVFCERLPELGIPPDVWRFVLSFLIPEEKDMEFTWSFFKEAINKELVGNFLNFYYRVTSFAKKKFGGKLRYIVDPKVKEEIEKRVNEIIENFWKVEIRKTLNLILRLSDYGNEYFQKREPWKEENPEETISTSLYILRAVATLLHPFIPKFSEEILETIGEEPKYENIFKEKEYWEIKEPKKLFKPINDEDIEKIKKIVMNPTPLEEILGIQRTK